MKIKKVIGVVLFCLAVILVGYFALVLNMDWLNWYANSAPFYIDVILRGIEFLLPAIICIVVGIILINKSRNN